MNISSLQPLNNKYIHIAYISIIAFLLLWATIGPSILRAAAQDDDARILGVLCNSYGEGVQVNREGRSETISFGEWLADQRPALVDLFNEVGCTGISASVSGGVVSGSVATRSITRCDEDAPPSPPLPACRDDQVGVDIDGDGVGDISILKRFSVNTFMGLVEGTGLLRWTSFVDIEAGTSTFGGVRLFTGTVGDSEPGTMSFIVTGFADTSDLSNFLITTTNVVVEGSGQGGLEGICGGGTTSAQGPAGGPFEGASEFEFRFGAACNDSI